MTEVRNPDKTTFSDPLFRWLIGICFVGLLWFVTKETLHFSNAPSFSTKEKEVKRESLPGGSRVWLNPNTRFSYGTPWLATVDRDLWIRGEAFFDLQPWGNMRYVIHTPYADIIAIDGRLTVSHMDEKVLVHNISGTLILRSGPENKFPEFFMKQGESYQFNKGLVAPK
ncbi:MAG: FecR family protein [Chitinophagaceae bacterium]